MDGGIALGGAVAHTQPVGLVVGAVGARDDLLVAPSSRQPGLQVVLPRCHRTHVACTDVDHSVVQPEAVPQADHVVKKLLVLAPAVVGVADHDLLHFGELVDAPDAAVRESVRANLPAEACRDAD